MRASLSLALAVLAVSTILLVACGRSQDSTPASPPPPADALPVADFTRPLNALGDQPFWALKIRPAGLTFSTAGAKDVAAPNPGPKVDIDQATWSAADGQGRPLTATLKATTCQDSATGASYPFTAAVNAGGRVLRGCATYADAGTGGG